MPETSPHYLWHELHEKGQSDQASILAKGILDSLPINNFTNKSVAVEHGEYARIAAVTALAAAKKSKTWPDAETHLTEALRVISGHYPLGNSETAAKQRNAYWEPVYGEKETAQLICLQDVLKLLQYLNYILPSKDLLKMIGGIEHLLVQITQKKDGQRFSLIWIMEHSEYPLARAAFRNFIEKFGPGSQVYDVTQVMTVISRMFGRAMDHKDYQFARECLNVWLRIVTPDLKLAVPGGKELLSHFSEERYHGKSKRRLQALAQNNPVKVHLQEELLVLLKYQWFGLGDKVVHLPDGQG